MAKPSIFSSDYEQKMKKRRRKIFFSIIFCIIIVLSIIFFINKNLKGRNKESSRKKFNIEFSNKIKEKKKKNVQDDVIPETEVKEEKKVEKEEIKEESFDIQLGDIKMSAVYEIKDNKKKFKELKGVGSNISYDINPSGSLMIICENASGTLILTNTDKKVANLTKVNYSSTSGNVFNRENIIQDIPGYIWCSNPVFIDNENIVYLSSLPWFDGRNTQYIWMVNVNTKEHINIQGVEGENIKFNELSDKGLSVTIDNKNLILNKNGIVK